MRVKLKLIDGIALAGISDSNHWVIMDGPEEFGGFHAGARPMELMLLGIAGCAAMDVLSILKKKRVDLQDFNMAVEAEKAEEHPQVFTKIRLQYNFYGRNIRATDVERAIELTVEKYCGATAMIKQVAELRHEYRINEQVIDP